MAESNYIVNREEFEAKLFEFYAGRKKCNRAVWTRKEVESVTLALHDVRNPRNHYCKQKYELLSVGETSSIIKKRKSSSDPFVAMIALEDFYGKLLEAHLQTGHGGRDKMIYYSREKWVVTKDACNIFTTCCQTCNRKRAAPKTGVVVKPISSDGYNIRGQVDLVDFQSCPDGEFKFLMNYQDHGTKFLHLRPLKSKHAVNVATELRKIFLTLGAPRILQSDNGKAGFNRGS